MTIARQFMIHAEAEGAYVEPLVRVMKLLRSFDQGILDGYAPQTNTAAASTYRATLMVAALSYGFQRDLRGEFRSLGFSVDDAVYATLYGSMP
jgi:hypothetical protein